MNIKLVILLGLCGTVSPSVVMAQNFGKVFSTQAERLYLDRERADAFAELSEQERQALLDAPPPKTPIEDVVAPTLIHMGGSIRRADGNHTVWLNGVAMTQSELPSNARLDFIRGLGVLRVQGADRDYIVKPGQTLNTDDGDIREDYELSAQDLLEVNAEVNAQDMATRDVERAATSRSSRQEPVTDSLADDDVAESERQTTIQNIVDGLRLLQQARSVGQ